MTNQKAFKWFSINKDSNLRIVSMIPGDRKVAGCINFYSSLGVL